MDPPRALPHPFNDRTWQYLQTITSHRTDHDQYEADLAEPSTSSCAAPSAAHVVSESCHLLLRDHGVTRARLVPWEAIDDRDRVLKLPP
ncbi:hypothetical protein [Streptomyces sp. NPDC030920]|uniref:hypothetical protein n=1 Tax=Streptomyces sp. NPDC030920 TaxID=3365308 RepID=UPI00384CDC54